MKHIYLLLFSLVLLACGNSEKNNQASINEHENTNEIVVTKQQFESENMQLGTLSEVEFNNSVKVNGMIDVPPQNKSMVSTFIGGYITKTPLLVGDKVKKGQLLVTLENTEFVEIQQDYLEIAEQLNYLKSEFTRQKTLYDENISSQKNYLKAESNYKSSLAHYNGLRKKLQMMNLNPSLVEQGNISTTINLYAAIEGYVTKVNVSSGSYVSPSDNILEIVDTDHIHLELLVFEKDILKIKKDQIINFKIPEASDEIFQAKVHLVGTTIDEVNRTVKVHGHVDDDDTNFIVGMFIESDIIVTTSKKFALPKNAISEIEGDYFALALTNKKDNDYYFKKIKLTIGKQTEEYIEILNIESIKEIQLLINGTYMLLNDGDSGGHNH